MTHLDSETSGTRHVYVCRYCGEPDPGEWGTGRKCPKHPSKGKIPPYMQECEFCPVPAAEALLTEEERKGLDYALDVAHKALDEGFSFPRDQNRAVLDSVREKLGLPHFDSPRIAS